MRTTTVRLRSVREACTSSTMRASWRRAQSTVAGMALGLLRNLRAKGNVYSAMKTLIAALLCLLVTGCATPLPSATRAPSAQPLATPTPFLVPPRLPPSPSPAIAVTCLGLDLGAQSPAQPFDCQPEEAAVLLAVARLGFPVRTITIGLFDFRCGGPFPTGVRSCPAMLAPTGGAAYVMFVGTPKVAAVTFTVAPPQPPNPPLPTTVVAFELPPAGWVLP